MGYAAPSRLSEALQMLADRDMRVVAGGTDFYPALGEGPAPARILDVSRINGLRGVTRTQDGWRIGAATTWSDIVAADLPAAFDGLKGAAREVGSLQIQNAATVAGNLCNASPAADGVPPLLTLGAEVELRSADGQRRLALSDFITGVRQVDLGAGELVTAILVPDLPETFRGGFLKLGARRYLVISIAMVAVLLALDGAGRITQARVAVGACSPVARRLGGLERALAGLDAQALAARNDIWSAHLDALDPIGDVRAPAAYRRAAAGELCRRAVLDVMERQGNG